MYIICLGVLRVPFSSSSPTSTLVLSEDKYVYIQYLPAAMALIDGRYLQRGPVMKPRDGNDHINTPQLLLLEPFIII